MDDQNNSDSPEIVEGEIVETPKDDNQATVLLSLENLIKSHISNIDKLTIELKNHRQMLADSFENDPTYMEHAEAAKKALKIKNTTKQEITKQPSVMQIAQKAKEANTELKELKSALSDYLKEYQRMAGVNEIEGNDGEVREIVTVVKVVKKRRK